MTIKQKDPVVSVVAGAIWTDSSWSKRTTVPSNDLRKGKRESFNHELFI